MCTRRDCACGRVGLENFVIDEDKAKESIEKNVESTMTPLIEIGVLARATSNQVTSTPTCSIENRDERDKEDAMKEDRRNLRGLSAAWRLGAISNLEYISAHQHAISDSEEQFSVSRLHALGYQFLEASFLFCRE